MGENMNLFEEEISRTKEVVLRLLREGRRPSPWEALEAVEMEIGIAARFHLESVLEEILAGRELTVADREFIKSLLRSEDFHAALHGSAPPRREAVSTIDALLHASKVYGDSGKFQEAVKFMSKFRNYSAYNNMLVWLQNPGCSFFATQKDWVERFRRHPKDDARPRIILAPMHPVLLVYDLDQTEGPPIPSHLKDFAKVEGSWQPTWWRLSVENAAKDGIRVVVRSLSSQLAGYVTRAASKDLKMFVVIHDGNAEPSRFGTLCHELAHVYLGHLGSDKDYWWPSRSGLDRHAMEVEAEAASHVVTSRLGLTGTSAAYVSMHLAGDRVPAGVSLDLIAKTAGRIEAMALRSLPKRETRKEKSASAGGG